MTPYNVRGLQNSWRLGMRRLELGTRVQAQYARPACPARKFPVGRAPLPSDPLGFPAIAPHHREAAPQATTQPGSIVAVDLHIGAHAVRKTVLRDMHGHPGMPLVDEDMIGTHSGPDQSDA